ncbi:glycoside hydrolase family 31 protein [Caloranaerobacter ferrireducens]|uniref:glycoside hydrolase family 31 protein n=1 Tax=Caloranaerobacter ferrireducens TaxID=1323370 RepID=UPI00084D28F5|nr:glycoside hydrolase family 31 protein [Caloranaerobacter ferrireducens]
MIKKTEYGYIIEARKGFLNIIFYDDNIVRFAYSKDGEIPVSTPAVVVKPKDIKHNQEGNIIKTKSLIIEIDKENLQISIFNKNGELLNRDINVDLEEIKIEKEILWEKGFYGLGEKYGWLNKKGTETSNWNTDVMGVSPVHNATIKEYHTSIPFYIGLSKSLCYGIYFDNSYRTYFDLGKTKDNVLKFSAQGGYLDYYFIYNEKVSEVVKAYTYLTGRMPLPRKDFLGYQQCRWSYENREELMEVARRMRKENIPCDVLYLDIDYMKDYKVFTVDSDKFFEFKDMVSELKDMGFKLVVIIDPGVKVEDGYWVYEQGKENDFYIKDKNGEVYIGEVWPGKAVFPDFLREKVRKWWGELHRGLIEDGVEGFWNDMNEPADFTTESKVVPEDTMHLNDQGEEKSHAEIHNLYGMLEAVATYEGVRSINPNVRPFVLTRAAFAGTQRYAALWTGDNTSIWEHLETSMPMFINLGLSGYSFIGADVGGFIGDSNGELLTRWTQLGAFTPLFRNHSVKGSINQEPWCFGEEVLENTRKFIKLRYNFITYLYNLMRESSINGHPAIRPLFYHYQDDEETYNINDQFLFGENILICPITRPYTRVRMVYLPEGIWYDYWTLEKFEGGRYIIKEVPIDSMPIFIKAGAIIPTDNIMQYVGEKDQEIIINCYLGQDGEYTLYLDDGISFDYEKGNYAEIKFIMKNSEKEASITSEVIKNGYKIPKMKLRILGLDLNSKVIMNGNELELNNQNIIDIDELNIDVKIIK